MSARSHFSIAGIPIRVEPVFFVIIVLFGLQYQRLWLILVWVAVAFTSILIHELGHGIAMKVFGQQSSIVLHGFGGVTIPRGKRAKWTKRRSIIVSLAGSLTALILLGLPARYVYYGDWTTEQIFNGNTEVVAAVYFCYFINVYWSLANLLPIRPLDGGNIATDLFGVSVARRISIATAVLAAVYAFTVDERYAGFFALMLAFFNFSEIRAEKTGSQINAFDVDAPDAPAPGSARPARGRPARGQAPLQSVPPMAPAQPLLPSQIEPQVWNALRDDDRDGARRIYARLADGVAVNPFLRASMTLIDGHDDKAVDQFAGAYVSEPSGPPNLVATELLSREGQTAAVVRQLLKRADGSGRDGAATLQTHLHYADRFRDAAVAGELVFAARPASPAQTAFEVACSWSRAADVDRAIEWLERAGELGFRAPGLLDGEPDLDPVRADPRWPLVRAALS